MRCPCAILSLIVVGLAAATEDHLVGWWRFDDVTGTRHFRDDSQFGNVLVSQRTDFAHQYAEAIPGAGLAGSGALRFWSRSKAVAKGVPAFKAISFWIKRDAGCCERIKDLIVATIGGKPFFSMAFAWGKLEVTITDTTGKTAKIQAKWPTGAEWDHFAVVIKSGGRATIFLNGEKGGSRKIKKFADRTGSVTEFRVGTGWPWYQFSGLMDEIRLYNREISKSEVAALAAAKDTGIPKGENLPPSVDPGPAVTVWKSSPQGLLEGICKDPHDMPTTAGWEVTSGPNLKAVVFVETGATTPFTLDPAAPPGDYVLTLTCSDGAFRRSADLPFVVFDGHEEKVGKTIETLGPNAPFADAGKIANPVALWLFDGDFSNSVPEGQDAKLHQLRGGDGKHSFEAAGRFGGALRLECNYDRCVQLDLGNPEVLGASVWKDAGWPAMTFSIWMKATGYHAENGVALLRKGSFEMPPKFWRSMEAGSWHHIVITQDKEIWKMYVDAKLVAPIQGGVMKGRSQSDVADMLTLGIRKGESPSKGFDGLVDEIAVYDFVLSNEEVEILYTTGAQTFLVRGTMNPYSRCMYNTTMMQFFPELVDQPDYAGFRLGESPSSDSPPAYVHPRIFFTPEELPDVRKRYLYDAAGRTMMENLRSLLESLQAEEYPWWAEGRMATEQDLYHPEILKPRTGGFDQFFVLEAFRALIDGDSAAAKRVGKQLAHMGTYLQANVEKYIKQWKAKHEKWKITAVDGINYDDSAFWTLDVSHDGVHELMLRGITVAYAYDFVYPWLEKDTRDKIRAAIAAATQGVWSLGMDSVQASPALGTNWLPWVTGDLAVTILAIEGEDGFDKGVYDRAAKAMLGFELLGVSAVSGAPYAGMGKNCIVTGKLMALAKHGYPQIIAGSGVKKHGTKWLLHTMLPNGYFWKEDMWGSVELKPARGDITGLKHAFPDDKTIDYVWRRGSSGFNYAGVGMDYGGGDGQMPYRMLAPWPNRYHTYGYDFLSELIYAEIWAGPPNRHEHIELATATEPLTYVASDTGQLITRSSWTDDDAAWLLFNVRTLPGDHASRSRGEFVFHAIGETWGFYHTDWNEPSEMHSVTLVDGEGQARWVPGTFLEYKDSPEATFASMDARANYGIEQLGGGFGRRTVNSFMLEPLPYPWGELTWNEMPNWYQGTGPDLPNMKGNGEMDDPPDEMWSSMFKPYVIDADPKLFDQAYRTVGLVRSENPYALIFDDIKKDAEDHAYAWRMPLRDTYYKYDPAKGTHELQEVSHSYFADEGGDMILRSTSGGPGRLLVRMLPGTSEYVSAKIVMGKGARKEAKGSSLEVVAKGTSARFRVLLWPLKDASSPLPETKWDAGTSTLTINGDEVKLKVLESGMTVADTFSMKGGFPTQFTTNEISSVPPAMATIAKDAIGDVIESASPARMALAGHSALLSVVGLVALGAAGAAALRLAWRGRHGDSSSPERSREAELVSYAPVPPRSSV